MCYNVQYSWILFPNFRRQNALHSRPKFCYPFNAFLVTHGVTKSVLYFPLLNLPAYISLPCLLNHHLQMSDVGMTTRRHITLHNASVCRLQRFFLRRVSVQRFYLLERVKRKRVFCCTNKDSYQNDERPRALALLNSPQNNQRPWYNLFNWSIDCIVPENNFKNYRQTCLIPISGGTLASNCCSRQLSVRSHQMWQLSFHLLWYFTV